MLTDRGKCLSSTKLCVYCLPFFCSLWAGVPAPVSNKTWVFATNAAASETVWTFASSPNAAQPFACHTSLVWHQSSVLSVVHVISRQPKESCLCDFISGCESFQSKDSCLSDVLTDWESFSRLRLTVLQLSRQLSRHTADSLETSSPLDVLWTPEKVVFFLSETRQLFTSLFHAKTTL